METYKLDDRWVWIENDLVPLKSGVSLKGYTSGFKYIGTTLFISITWENGRTIAYSKDNIQNENRLSYDKQFYRNQKLEH